MRKADAAFAKASKAGQTADKYIRATVFLATVLFLVGISGHFRIRQARMGLIGAGGLLAGVRGDPVARPSRTARLGRSARRRAALTGTGTLAAAIGRRLAGHFRAEGLPALAPAEPAPAMARERSR